MKTYRFKIVANQKGAIGKPENFTKQVKANTFKEANLKLYDWYDHIRIEQVNGIKYDPYNEPD